MPRSLLPRRFTPPRFLPSLSRDTDSLDATIRRMLENPFASAADLFADLPQPIGWMPPVEVTEDDAAITLSAELPGADPKDVHVELDGDLLTIRGEKQEERTDDKKKYHVVERAYGAFLRAFTLPSGVDPAKIAASFQKGVLTVTMPKTSDARPRGREIAVTAK